MDTKESFLHRISLLLRSNSPALTIETDDETWLLEQLRALALAHGRVFRHIEDSTPNWDSLTIEDIQAEIVVFSHSGEDFFSRFSDEWSRLYTIEESKRCIIWLGKGLGQFPRCIERFFHLSTPLPSHEERQNIITSQVSTLNVTSVESLAYLSAGLTRTELKRIIKICLILSAEKMHKMRWEDALMQEKQRIFSNRAAIEIINASESLDNVGGMKDLKSWLLERKQAFSQKAIQFGIPNPKGLLLVGVQGCGKSLLSKAVANYWQFPLLRLDLSALFASNESPEASLYQSLRISKSMAPCILWIDEIDKAFQVRDATSSRLLSSLLLWLQEKENPVFVIASANQAETLPPELTRKGRFDELFFVDLPDDEARKEIFSIHLRKRKRSPSAYHLDSFVGASQNLSGAEIEQVIISALHKAFSKNRDLMNEDILDAINETVSLYVQREDEIKAMREWAKQRTRFAETQSKLLSYFS